MKYKQKVTIAPGVVRTLIEPIETKEYNNTTWIAYFNHEGKKWWVNQIVAEDNT